jgi:DNA ligase (NAD+)
MGYYEDIELLLPYMSIASIATDYERAEKAYRAGSPIMTDAEFDQLKEELHRLAPHHPYLNPGGLVMLSLKNNRIVSFDDWYEALPGSPELVVQPKIDGISIGLRYVDGKLTAAQTRKGRCALKIAKLALNIPHKIKAKGTVEIHGELWGLPESEDDNRSAQSIAAVASRLNRAEGSGLLFDAYRIIGALEDELKSIEDLQGFGFKVPDTRLCTKPSQVRDYHAKWLRWEIFDAWPTDGIVVKVLDQRLQRKLGANSVAPNWALALKKHGRT